MMASRMVMVVMVVCCVPMVLLSQASGSPARQEFSSSSIRRHRRADEAAEEASCMKCQPGSFAIRPCFHKTSTVCEPCPQNSFTSAPNLDPQCQPCSSCPQGFFQIEACTSISDTLCEACTPTTCPDWKIGADMMDMMFGDDHSTLTDNLKATAPSPEVKDHNKESLPSPEHHKDNDAGAHVSEEEKKDISDVKSAAVKDEVDVLLGSVAAENEEGSGDGENLVSETPVETPTKESVSQPTPQPIPPADEDKTSPPSLETDAESNGGAHDIKENDGDSDAAALSEDKTTLATTPEKQSAEHATENLVSDPEEEKDEPQVDKTTAPLIPTEHMRETNEEDARDDDDTLPSPPAVVDDGGDDQDEAESEPTVQKEFETHTEPSVQTTHQPDGDKDKNEDDSVVLVGLAEEEDHGENTATTRLPEDREESEDHDEEHSDDPVLSVSHSVLNSSPSEQNKTDADPVAVDGDTDDNDDIADKDADDDDIADKDADEEEVAEKDPVFEAGDMQTTTDDGMSTSSDNEDVNEDNEADEEVITTSDSQSPVPSIPATSPQPDVADVTDVADVADDDDDDSSKETEPVDHDEETTTASMPDTSDKEGDHDVHVPILIHHSEELEDKDAEEDDKELAHETTLEKSGMTPAPEEPKNDTDSVHAVIAPHSDDDDADEDIEKVSSPEPVTRPAQAEDDDDDDDDDGAKTTTLTPVETHEPHEEKEREEEEEEEEEREDDHDHDTLTSIHTEPQQSTIPVPTVKEDQSDDHSVPVVLIPEEEKESSPTTLTFSTTRRIPTLEEVEENDLGSGYVPGIVLTVGEGEKKEVVDVDVEVVDHNVTTPGTEESEEGGVNVVIGGGDAGEKEEEEKEEKEEEQAEGEKEEEDEVTTRQTPGRPEDGTRRGEFGPVVSEDSSEKAAEEEGHYSDPEVERGDVEIEEEEIIEEELEIEPAKQGGDTEEDVDGKRRTAIIVGVAVGGVALFALGFFLTRYCRKRGAFKIMKKVPHDNGTATNGNAESIEFRPVRSDSGIYQEVDEATNPPVQGSYKRVADGGYTPLPTSTITPTHLTSFTTAPNGDTYAVVAKKRPPSSKDDEINEPILNGIDRIRYIDETTDDEGVEPTPRDRLLPLRHYHAALPEIDIEDDNAYRPPEPETRPPASSFSGESMTSLPEDVLRNVEGQVMNGDGGHGSEKEEEEKVKILGGKEMPNKGMVNGNLEVAVTVENGLA